MAEFYGSVAGYKDYCNERGRSIGAMTDIEIAQNLLNASIWLDGIYGAMFGGEKVGGREQKRLWPRNGAQDKNGNSIVNGSTPYEVEYATYEGAYKISTGTDLMVDFTPGKYKSVRVDGAVSVEYITGQDVNEIQSQFQLINILIDPVLTGNGSTGSKLTGFAYRV